MKAKAPSILNILLAVIIGVLGTVLFYEYNQKNVQTKNQTVQSMGDTVKNVTITETNTIKEAVNKVYDAAVLVEVTTRTGTGTGSGFVYRKDSDTGYIITNHHVVDGATDIYVINSEGVRTEAKLLGSDEYGDIAVLSIAGSGVISVATVGDSTKAELGDTVFTVGSPLGSKYQGTVTKGIISGKDREITVRLTNGSFVMTVLQIDAAINPGNSGGPLVDMNGEVIGVNSMKLVEDEIEGMGFAIPIELAMASVGKLEKGETIQRPQLGIQLLDIEDSYLLSRYQIRLSSDVTSGVVLVAVEEGKPAATAGLEKGDVIVAINGSEIKDSAHFKYMLYKYEVGDSINVDYIRNGKKRTTKINLTLGLN